MGKDPPDKYTTKKICLDKIIKNSDSLRKLLEFVYRTSELRTHIGHFLKLYILDKYHKNQQIPTITRGIIAACCKTLINGSNKGPKIKGSTESILLSFNKFYENVYNKLNYSKINGINMSGIIDNIEIDVLKNIENNIKLNFFKYMKRFINASFKITNNEILSKFSGKEKINMKKQLSEQLYKIYNDLLNHTKESDIQYHEWIDAYQSKILPKKSKHSYQIDINNDPQKYIPYMIYMNIKLEKKQSKLFQVFPLKSSSIACYVPFDTKTLIEIFIKKDKNKYFKNIRDIKKDVWNIIFNMDHNIFKMEGYTFDYRISTDGYAVSLQFINNKYIEKENKKKNAKLAGLKKAKKENKTKTIKEIELNKKIKQENKKQQNIQKAIEYKNKTDKPKKAIEFPYIDELTDVQIENMNVTKKVFVDPGKKNLLTMMDDYGNKLVYSNKERLYKTKRLKYMKKIQSYKKKRYIDKFEHILSNYSSKTCNYEKFKEYIYYKNNINKILIKEYKKNIFRQYRWYSYINTNRSEKELITKIKEKFGKHLTIIIGDWSIGKQMRNFISTPMIGLKRKLKEYFDVYQIDEYKTSCINYKTETACENLYLPDKKGILRKLHSVLTFKMENKRIGCINRDFNAVNNMRKIADYWFNNHSRPVIFKRASKKKVTTLPKKVSNVTKSAQSDQLMPINQQLPVKKCKTKIHIKNTQDKKSQHPNKISKNNQSKKYNKNTIRVNKIYT